MPCRLASRAPRQAGCPKHLLSPVMTGGWRKHRPRPRPPPRQPRRQRRVPRRAVRVRYVPGDPGRVLPGIVIHELERAFRRGEAPAAAPPPGQGRSLGRSCAAMCARRRRGGDAHRAFPRLARTFVAVSCDPRARATRALALRAHVCTPPRSRAALHTSLRRAQARGTERPGTPTSGSAPNREHDPLLGKLSAVGLTAHLECADEPDTLSAR